MPPAFLHLQVPWGGIMSAQQKSRLHNRTAKINPVVQSRTNLGDASDVVILASFPDVGGEDE
jgi:hypothetical protein